MHASLTASNGKHLAHSVARLEGGGDGGGNPTAAHCQQDVGHGGRAVVIADDGLIAESRPNHGLLASLNSALSGSVPSRPELENGGDRCRQTPHR